MWAYELFLASLTLATYIVDLHYYLIQHYIFFPCGQTLGRRQENEGGRGFCFLRKAWRDLGTLKYNKGFRGRKFLCSSWFCPGWHRCLRVQAMSVCTCVCAWNSLFHSTGAAGAARAVVTGVWRCKGIPESLQKRGETGGFQPGSSGTVPLDRGVPSAKEGPAGVKGSWGWLSAMQLPRMLKQRELAEIMRLRLVCLSKEETWHREKDEGSGICNAKATRTFSRAVFWFARLLLGMGSSSGLAD